MNQLLKITAINGVVLWVGWREASLHIYIQDERVPPPHLNNHEAERHFCEANVLHLCPSSRMFIRLHSRPCSACPRLDAASAAREAALHGFTDWPSPEEILPD